MIYVPKVEKERSWQGLCPFARVMFLEWAGSGHVRVWSLGKARQMRI